jgi:hypothetical protein
MTKEERELSIEYLEDIQNNYIEGYGYERHPLPEYYAIENAIKALEQEPILDKIRAEIKDTLYVDSLIFGELIDFKNGKISADDVIEEFNRVTRMEVLQIIDKYKSEE